MIDRYVPPPARVAAGLLLGVAGLVFLAAGENERRSTVADPACSAPFTVAASQRAASRICEVIAGRVERTYVQTKSGHWNDAPSAYDRVYHIVVAAAAGRPPYDVALTSNVPVYDDASRRIGERAAIATLHGVPFTIATPAGVQRAIAGSLPEPTLRGLIAALFGIALAGPPLAKLRRRRAATAAPSSRRCGSES